MESPKTTKRQDPMKKQIISNYNLIWFLYPSKKIGWSRADSLASVVWVILEVKPGGTSGGLEVAY